jgi:hypothetical protein
MRKIMEIYILDNKDCDGITEILGAFSSIENANKYIKGKTYYGRMFDGSFVDNTESVMAEGRYDGWYHLTKLTVDKEEI